MLLSVNRQIFTKLSTIGNFLINGKLECFTLEDTVREDGKKVYGETAIPAGKYEVTLRKEGTIYEDYCKRFDDIGQERGTLWIRNIPGYEYVLIHIGNYPKDTLGCILVGAKMSGNSIQDSTIAYKKIYPIIASALEKGEKVHIEVK